MDPKQGVFENYEYISKIVKYRTNHYDLDYDDTLNYVLEKITENDYQKIRAFRGESKFPTFLTVVVNRLVFSYARKNRKIPELPVMVKNTPLDILIEEQELDCRMKVEKRIPLLLEEIESSEKLVIKMKYFKDMKISQISKTLKSTRYEIKKMLNSALLFFQDKIKEICGK